MSIDYNPPFADAARDAAAGAVQIDDPNSIHIEVDMSDQVVIVNWPQSMLIGSEGWRKVESAVKAILPGAYRDFRVTVT